MAYDTSGNVLFRQKGKASEVSFSPKQAQQLRGSLLTHNHPDGSSLSPNDLHMMLLHRIQEVRACNTEGAFVARLTETAKPPPSLEEFRNRYFDLLKKHGLKARKASIVQGISFRDALRKADDDALRELCAGHGINYSWEARP